LKKFFAPFDAQGKADTNLQSDLNKEINKYSVYIHRPLREIEKVIKF